MKGILFKPELIKAVAEGRKTQTRRVIKPQPPEGCSMAVYCYDKLPNFDEWVFAGEDGDPIDMKCPQPRYYAGETVYIKEAFQVCDIVYDEYAGGSEAGYPLTVVPTVKPAYQVMATYKLDGIDDGPWRSPIFMPAWAARYFIEITEVKAQRVQEITEEDAEAEGESWMGYGDGENYDVASAVECFANLWNSLNPKHPFESNPWVWAITFRLKEGAA